IAAVAGMLRLRRSEPGGVPRLTWTAMAVGGFLLAATRPVGPGWLLQAAVLLVLLLPGVHLVEKAKSQPKWASAVGATWLIGIGLSLGWQVYAPPPPPVGSTAVLHVRSSIAAMPLYI